MTHPFDQDTAVTRLDEDRFSAELSERWWGYTAAHGGYLGAILLRAMQERADDPARTPRSLNVHYLRGPKAGPVEVHTTLERAGGRLSTLSARLVQDGKPTTLAMAALGAPMLEGEGFQDLACPEAPAPQAVELHRRSKVAIDHRFEHRPCLGEQPFSGAGQATYGGWGRLADGERALDALSLVPLCDSFWPCLFTRLDHKKQAGAVPTVDLTVHFRATLPVSDPDPAGWGLFDLESRVMRDGYLEESCRMWSPDGLLLAQSVQHAVRVLPRNR